MKSRLLLSAAAILCSGLVGTQQRPVVTAITGHVVKAERLEPTDTRAKLVAPAGFDIDTFASGLGKPRVLAVSEDGTVYATRRDTGDVIMLRDQDRDGKAEAPVIVARRPQMHGIALSGTKVYLVTVKELFVTERASNGTFGSAARAMRATKAIPRTPPCFGSSLTVMPSWHCTVHGTASRRPDTKWRGSASRMESRSRSSHFLPDFW